MKIVSIGDNVADCYLDQKIYYPGGNAVNVAVNSKRNGAEVSSYIGIFGGDALAKHIKHALESEGIDISRCRETAMKSGHPCVKLDEKGDRIFVKSPRDTCQRMLTFHFIDADLEYIGNHDIIHVNVNSQIDHELSLLKSLAPIAYDFSNKATDELLEKVCPHIKYAFISTSHLSQEERNILIEKCHSLGVSYVILTMGSKGSMLSDGEKIYNQSIVKVNSIDELGAGDSFIAGFLTAHLRGEGLENSLQYAAEKSAQTCLMHGGIGYPKAFETDMYEEIYE